MTAGCLRCKWDPQEGTSEGLRVIRCDPGFFAAAGSVTERHTRERQSREGLWIIRWDPQGQKRPE